ncbi:hypothetical protein DYB32_008997 [Aphanomyces invadans]|nr:hypothetical protein DYB32_008997 [Aphanomyces invadans]
MSMRRYYAKNRDKELLRFKAYYQKNKDKIRAYKKRAREQSKRAIPRQPTVVAAETAPQPTTVMDIRFLCQEPTHKAPPSAAPSKMNLAFLLN